MASDYPESGFGRYLRSWRRRRGFSRLELAERSGTTPRHLLFIETGRSRPRTGMVLRLAQALSLPPREQNAALEAAGLPAVFPDLPLEAPEMAPFREAVQSLPTSHDPLPAAVLDRYGAIVEANAGFERLTPGLVGVAPETLVERLFGPGAGRDAIVSWTDAAAA